MADTAQVRKKKIIISTEKNLVVQRRAEKINIPYIQGVNNKKITLIEYVEKHNIDLSNVAYIGNDINDLEVMKIVGTPISPADGVSEIRKIAKIITRKNGGEGVIREIYNLIKK